MSAYLLISTVPFLILSSLMNVYNQLQGYHNSASKVMLEPITSGEYEPGGSAIRCQCKDKLLALE